jgi:hypothetical protein
MASSRICSIPDCGKTVRVKSRGWCNAHWIRWSRYGDPLLGQRPRDAAYNFIQKVAVPHKDKTACLIWTFTKTGDGYGRLGLNGERVAAHRFVCEAVNGKPPTPNHEAAHSCGNGHIGCVNPHHLSWKTRSENFADKLLHDTHNRGERNGHASITEAQARKVLSLKGRASRVEISRITGVTPTNVTHIHKGNSWRWLSES